MGVEAEDGEKTIQMKQMKQTLKCLKELLKMEEIHSELLEE